MAIASDKSQDIVNIFNSYNHSLQFTIELEQNFKISFLDILLDRSENKIPPKLNQKSKINFG